MRTVAAAVLAALAGAYGMLRGVEWGFGWYVRRACRDGSRVLP